MKKREKIEDQQREPGSKYAKSSKREKDPGKHKSER